MKYRLIWDDAKRAANLAKHGLDFADARSVLESRYRLDIPVRVGAEDRIQSLSYVTGRLCVLTVVHVARDGCTRVISYRKASTLERKAYYDWLKSE